MNFPVVGMASRLTQMWECKKPHLQSLSISCSPFQSPAVSSSGLLQSHPVYYGLFHSTAVSSSLLRRLPVSCAIFQSPVVSSSGLFQSTAVSSSLLCRLPVSCSFFQWSLPVYSSLFQSPAQSSSLPLQSLPVSSSPS